jgi:acetylornithine deacetylase
MVDFGIDVMRTGDPFTTPADSQLVTRLVKSCERSGISSNLEGAAWYSDAGPLSGVCENVVVFGPGDIRQAHTSEEYIELESLEAGCKVLSSFFELMVEDAQLE